MKFFLATAFLLISFFSAFAQHEYAPLQEQELKYKDWTYRSLRGDSQVNLRQFTQGKKLVLVVYFAAWCHNWKNQAPFVQKIYDKYRAQGLDVVAVAEYESIELTQKYFDEKKFTFPVVFESLTLGDREKTPHYDYRKKTGDTRKWGSPWNIFLEPANMLKKDGDTLVKKAFVVNGELIEDEVDKFIREKLGVKATEAKTGAQATKSKEIEACDPVKDFKTPDKKP